MSQNSRIAAALSPTEPRTAREASLAAGLTTEAGLKAIGRLLAKGTIRNAHTPGYPSRYLLTDQEAASIGIVTMGMVEHAKLFAPRSVFELGARA